MSKARFTGRLRHGRVKMQHKFCCLVALLAALFLPAITPAQGRCPEEDHHASGGGMAHLWTGPDTGYYFQVGRAIDAASKHMPDGIRIHNCASNGSESNVAALLSGQADFAIVQMDVAHEWWRCEVPEAHRCRELKQPSRIRLITPLFIEKAQVLVRPHLYVSSLADLRSSHCIWIGGRGSGSEPTARALLEATGWSRGQIEEIHSGCHKVPSDLKDALTSLKEGGDLDAVIQTRVAPFRPIYTALGDSEIQLLGIDWSIVQRMTQDGIYREASLQRNEYPSVGETTYTIGVPALLLTSDAVDGDTVRALAELIEDHQDDIENHLRRNLLAEGGGKGDTDRDTPAMVDGKIIGPTTLTLVGSKLPDDLLQHVDPEAKDSLWSWALRRGAVIRLAMLVAALAALGIFLRLHSGGRRVICGYLREFLFVLGGILVWTIAAVWLQAIEGDLNEHFTTLWSSALSLAENALAKLPLQFSFAPTPTTRNGSAVVSGFSYLVASLVTIYLLPRLKKSWPRFRPAFWGWDAREAEKTAPQAATSAAPQESIAEKEKQDKLSRAARA